jgi:hypothetical protein
MVLFTKVECVQLLMVLVLEDYNSKFNLKL